MMNAEHISKRDAAMEGRHKARVAIWSQVFRRKYNDDISKREYSSLVDRDDGMFEELTLLLDNYGGPKPKVEGDGYYAVTINPPPYGDDYIIEFQKLKCFVEKLLTLKRMPPVVAYAYDQRSDDPDDYYGLHCHMLVHTTDLYPSNIQSIVYNCAKGLKQYGDAITYPAINVQSCKPDWIQYVKGEKTDEKHGVVETTRSMLDSLGEEYYRIIKCV